MARRRGSLFRRGRLAPAADPRRTRRERGFGARRDRGSLPDGAARAHRDPPGVVGRPERRRGEPGRAQGPESRTGTDHDRGDRRAPGTEPERGSAVRSDTRAATRARSDVPSLPSETRGEPIPKRLLPLPEPSRTVVAQRQTAARRRRADLSGHQEYPPLRPSRKAQPVVGDGPQALAAARKRG